MTTAHPRHYDYAEYLVALDDSPLKLEYCGGVIYALAGGTPAHAQLAAAMIVVLRQALPKECRIATSDLKVRVDASDLSTFPDVSVVCDPQMTSPIDSNAIVNPTFLVEVTSKSTEDYDRREARALPDAPECPRRPLRLASSASNHRGRARRLGLQRARIPDRRNGRASRARSALRGRRRLRRHRARPGLARDLRLQRPSQGLGSIDAELCRSSKWTIGPRSPPAVASRPPDAKTSPDFTSMPPRFA
jgi:hypothetical protein